MTGFADQRERADGLDRIDHDVVPKPFSLAEIRTAVGGALAAGRGRGGDGFKRRASVALQQPLQMVALEQAAPHRRGGGGSVEDLPGALRVDRIGHLDRGASNT